MGSIASFEMATRVLHATGRADEAPLRHSRATNMATRLDRIFVFAGSAVVLTGIAAWLLFPTLAETEPTPSISTAVLDQTSTDTNRDATPAVAPSTSPSDAAELSRLSLHRQSFRRGGLGSKALMTFTVRNANDYAVKDLEISCDFRSRDGHYTTERRRMIPDTVAMKSHKAFRMTPMGFVNIKAEKAKCSLVTASRA